MHVAARTGDKLLTNTILVTGAAGQVGSRLVHRLVAAGRDVRALVLPNDPNIGRLEGLEIDMQEGNVLDETVAASAVNGVDAIVHAANLLGPLPGMSPNEFFQNNVQSTYNIAYEAAQTAATIDRLVYISSSAVYPNGAHKVAPAYNPIDEIHPLRPLGSYAASKVASEHLIDALGRESGLEYSIVRPSGVLSGSAPLDRCTVGFYASILRAGGRHPEGTLYLEGERDLAAELETAAPATDIPCAITDEQGRPWLDQPVHVNDLVHGIRCALEHPAAVGEAFNIAAPRREPAPRTAELHADKTGKPVFSWEAPVRWIFDLEVSKAKEQISYEPTWDFERMVGEAWANQATT